MNPHPLTHLGPESLKSPPCVQNVCHLMEPLLFSQWSTVIILGHVCGMFYPARPTLVSCDASMSPMEHFLQEVKGKVQFVLMTICRYTNDKWWKIQVLHTSPCEGAALSSNVTFSCMMAGYKTKYLCLIISDVMFVFKWSALCCS